MYFRIRSKISPFWCSYFWLCDVVVRLTIGDSPHSAARFLSHTITSQSNNYTKRPQIRIANWNSKILLIYHSKITSHNITQSDNLIQKLALELHPDKNPDDPAAKDKFIEINEIYEILKDEDSRKRYDLFGEKAKKSGSWIRSTCKSPSSHLILFGSTFFNFLH